MNLNSTLFRKPEVKSQTLSIRLSPAQKQAISKLAEKEGVSVSVLLLESIGHKYECLNNPPDCTLLQRV
jgi:uncharacterized protein (DUF1778 family)